MLPKLDLSPFFARPRPGDTDYPSAAQRAVATALDDAFRAHGFLLLDGHGIGADDVAAMFEHARALFAMPEQEKIARLPPVSPRTNAGYVRMGLERLDPAGKVDPKEAFNYKFTADVPGLDFSSCPSGFEERARSFWDKTCRAADAFADACALALGLPPFFFSAQLGARQNNTVRLLHYPPLPATDWRDVVRTGEHTDFGLFTLLFTDGPGLQARGVHATASGSCTDTNNNKSDSDTNDEWTDVDVVPAPTAVVNGGALLARWTNDRWFAAAHRVVAPQTRELARQHRFTIACFVDPHPDTVVQVHPVLRGAAAGGHDDAYPPVTAGAYLKMRLDEVQGSDRRGLDDEAGGVAAQTV